MLETKGIEKEKQLAQLLLGVGFNFAVGVPCGVLQHIIRHLQEKLGANHLYATRESEAIGLAGGAYLAGKKPLVYMQNSGFLNSINDISSLLLAYKIPTLLIISWRGAPGEDAPQHFLNGSITTDILKLLGIPYCLADQTDLPSLAKFANQKFAQGRVAAIVIKRGDFE
jgi:phosphonopyruvate decarboxylase